MNARFAAALLLACSIAGCRVAQGPRPVRALMSLDANAIVPAPVSVTTTSGAAFTLTANTAIVVPVADSAVARIGERTAAILRPSTGFRLPVTADDRAAPRGAIVFRLDGAQSLGDEGYELVIGADSLVVRAPHPAGLFHGMQTVRQLLPSSIESQIGVRAPGGAWLIPAGHIVDQPRFAWRGAMLDVARHFFTVYEVEQYIDLLALYKLNVLHLHLSDDQGWRIQIDSWPKLTTSGSTSNIAGGRGGFYTKQDYAELVRYAQDRYITIVPEIEMPGHAGAARNAYPELGCGTGWNTLCPDSALTYRFVDDVVREIAAMTPGSYMHIGGDEVEGLTPAQYSHFVERVQDIVYSHGKTLIGWEEIGKARLRPTSIAQQWRTDSVLLAVKQGARLVVSPSTNAYLDMKYTPETELGLDWAGHVELRTAYDWDPVAYLPGITAADVVGVEAPLWSETVQNITTAEYLAVPRLPAVAEVAWSPASARDWNSFRRRIAAHAPRWRLLGINYYPSPQVDW